MVTVWYDIFLAIFGNVRLRVSAHEHGKTEY